MDGGDDQRHLFDGREQRPRPAGHNVVQKIPRTSNTPGRRQGRRRQGEEEEEVERVHGRQVGYEVLLKRGEDYLNEVGGRAFIENFCFNAEDHTIRPKFN